jgi:hypothetical protein
LFYYLHENEQNLQENEQNLQENERNLHKSGSFGLKNAQNDKIIAYFPVFALYAVCWVLPAPASRRQVAVTHLKTHFLA